MDAITTTHDQITELVLRWIGALNADEVLDADAIASSDFLEHAIAPFVWEAPGLVAGPAHLRDTVAWLRGQFPDLRMTPEAILVDQEMVCVRVLSEGTNLGPLGGRIPATGRPFRSEQSHWFRVQDGRLAEHWATRDDLTTMLQLGVLTPPGGAPR